MTKFYIASLFSELELTHDNALQIEDRLGWECTSSWVEGKEDGMSRYDISKMDLEDVQKADALVIISHPRSTPQPGGGRWVEFGYALALGKTCYVVGPYENVFCHGEGVKVYPTLNCMMSDLEVQ